MPKPSTWVVKLGGSLIGSAHLRRWLAAIVEAGRTHRIVVVPGGGPFADAVRTTQASLGIDDPVAHAMAVQGMRQFGTALAALTKAPNRPGLTQLAEITAQRGDHGLWIWDPLDACLGRCPLPRDWRVTSDSLSLWLCGEIDNACLVLVKSAAPALGNASDIQALAEEGFVDEYFPVLWSQIDRPAWWLARAQSQVLMQLLSGSPMQSNVIEAGRT